MGKISENKFAELLMPQLGADWERALKTFRDYGPLLSFDVANVMLHAADQGKVGEVLTVLERHYREHLSLQHPMVRGTVRDRLLDVNPTEIVFLTEIGAGILGLRPSPDQVSASG